MISFSKVGGLFENSGIHGFCLKQCSRDGSRSSTNLVGVGRTELALSIGYGLSKLFCQYIRSSGSIECQSLVDGSLKSGDIFAEVDGIAKIGKTEVIEGKPVSLVLLQFLYTNGDGASGHNRSDTCVQISFRVILEDAVEGIGIVGIVSVRCLCFGSRIIEQTVNPVLTCTVEDRHHICLVFIDEIFGNETFFTSSTTLDNLVSVTIAIVSLKGKRVFTIGHVSRRLFDAEAVGVPYSV